MTDKKAINILKEHQEHWERLVHEKICSEDDGIETIKALEIAIKAIEQIPKGEWRYTDNRWGLGDWECDKCHKHSNKDSDFCPNCGADMRDDNNGIDT